EVAVRGTVTVPPRAVGGGGRGAQVTRATAVTSAWVGSVMGSGRVYPPRTDEPAGHRGVFVTLLTSRRPAGPPPCASPRPPTGTGPPVPPRPRPAVRGARRRGAAAPSPPRWRPRRGAEPAARRLRRPRGAPTRSRSAPACPRPWPPAPGARTPRTATGTRGPPHPTAAQPCPDRSRTPSSRPAAGPPRGARPARRARRRSPPGSTPPSRQRAQVSA